jgi:Tfp pilus assembly protein PilW
MSRTQENARFSTDILTRYLRLADFRPDNEDQRLALLPSLPDAVDGCIVGSNCGAGFAGNSELPAVPLANSHAVHVKYAVPYDGMRDCTGGIVDKNDRVTATFSVGSAAAGEPPSLYCGTSVNGGPANTAPLIQGVSDLQVEYGIVTGAGGIRYTSHQDDDNDLPGAAEWPSVIALRVLVTVESGDETLSTKAKQQLEGRADRQFQATVQLRNRRI